MCFAIENSKLAHGRKGKGASEVETPKCQGEHGCKAGEVCLVVLEKTQEERKEGRELLLHWWRGS